MIQNSCANRSGVRSRRSRPWIWICRIVLLVMMLTTSWGCERSISRPVRPSIVYVPDSRKVILIDVNDPNGVPWGWYAISPGNLMRLTRIEGWAIEHGYRGDYP